jgi:hypothetical protein
MGTPDVVTAEVRFTPATVSAACLLAEGDDERWPHGPAFGRRLTHGEGEDGSECPRWLYATIELPSGFDAAAIERATVRLAGAVGPDPTYGALVDEDHDGRRELKVRFVFGDVRPRLVVGTNTLRVTGRVGAAELRGDSTLPVTALVADLWFTPRTLNGKSRGESVQARLTFPAGVAACEVASASLRLNETVPAQRKVSCDGRRFVVKFDRDAVSAVVPVGENVELRVTGVIRGVAFTARDYIRVIP